MKLILSLFPGWGLLDRAFEAADSTILRGPDLLWGGDIRNFHVPSGVFWGVIGGPPCQGFSTCKSMFKKKHDDLIGEFVRIVKEAQPAWVLMENVRGAKNSPYLPQEWFPIRLRDWDCGGKTWRTRVFWIYPPHLILSPPKRSGKPEYSVLSTSWKTRNQEPDGKGFRGHEYISVEKAAELQGYPELIPILKPLGRAYAVSLLGNGVPRAMGEYIANQVIKAVGGMGEFVHESELGQEIKQ